MDDIVFRDLKIKDLSPPGSTISGIYDANNLPDDKLPYKCQTCNTIVKNVNVPMKVDRWGGQMWCSIFLLDPKFKIDLATNRAIRRLMNRASKLCRICDICDFREKIIYLWYLGNGPLIMDVSKVIASYMI